MGRLSGKGEAGSKGGTSGDLYLFISIDNHNIFKRSDENLYYELPISFSDAALGTSVEVPSIDGGRSKIKIPSGSKGGTSGDLYLFISIDNHNIFKRSDE